MYIKMHHTLRVLGGLLGLVMLLGCNLQQPGTQGQSQVSFQLRRASQVAASRNAGPALLVAPETIRVHLVAFKSGSDSAAQGGSDMPLIETDLVQDAGSLGVFSLDLSLEPGNWVFSVSTFDASNNVLTSGSTTQTLYAGANEVPITLQPVSWLYPGDTISLAPGEIRYFLLSSSDTRTTQIYSPAINFTLLNNDGSTLGQSATSLSANLSPTPVILRASLSSSAAASVNGYVGPAWIPLGTFVDGSTVAGLGYSSWEYFTTLDDVLYLASPSNTTGTQFFVSIDSSSLAVSHLSTSGNDLQAAGYSSDILGTNGALWYVANSATSFNVSSGTWSSFTGPASYRGEPGAAVLGQTLYLFGSRDNADTFMIYNTATGVWSESAANSAQAGSWSGVAAWNNLLYVVGGVHSTLGALDLLSSYNPSTDTWTSLAAPGLALYGASTVAWNGKLLVFNNPTLEYDIANNMWLAPAYPIPSTPGGKVVAAGGYLWTYGYNSTANSFELYRLLE